MIPDTNALAQALMEIYERRSRKEYSKYIQELTEEVVSHNMMLSSSVDYAHVLGGTFYTGLTIGYMLKERGWDLWEST